MAKTKYIFVTGGVTSSLGKGIIAASLAKLLQAQGYRTTIQKLDPYINVDPGTLNPYEHGECYVTDDGAETDLDLGHSFRTSLPVLDFVNRTIAGLGHEAFGLTKTPEPHEGDDRPGLVAMWRPVFAAPSPDATETPVRTPCGISATRT